MTQPFEDGVRITACDGKYLTTKRLDARTRYRNDIGMSACGQVTTRPSCSQWTSSSSIQFSGVRPSR